MRAKNGEGGGVEVRAGQPGISYSLRGKEELSEKVTRGVGEAKGVVRGKERSTQAEGTGW